MRLATIEENEAELRRMGLASAQPLRQVRKAPGEASFRAAAQSKRHCSAIDDTVPTRPRRSVHARPECYVYEESEAGENVPHTRAVQPGRARSGRERSNQPKRMQGAESDLARCLRLAVDTFVPQESSGDSYSIQEAVLPFPHGRWKLMLRLPFPGSVQEGNRKKKDPHACMDTDDTYGTDTYDTYDTYAFESPLYFLPCHENLSSYCMLHGSLGSYEAIRFTRRLKYSPSEKTPNLILSFQDKKVPVLMGIITARSKLKE